MPAFIFIVAGGYATLLALVVLTYYLKGSPEMPRHVALMASSWIALMASFNICKSGSPFALAADVLAAGALFFAIWGLHLLLPRLK